MKETSATKVDRSLSLEALASVDPFHHPHELALRNFQSSCPLPTSTA